jgi:3-oxoacyl-[acyl-carrier-protein] synthase II
MTAPMEKGEGALLAMKRALKNAGLPPSAVDYVNAHATSTPLGDTAENAAIKSLLLGPQGKSSASQINVSSTKGAIAHLLGAAGAIEAVFSILAVHEVRKIIEGERLLLTVLQNKLPPTLNVENLTDGFDCNYVPKVAQDQVVNVALTNSFGFGGTNSTLCFAKYV